MSGARETIASPSISSTRRSTPCVDGCCGPMLSTIECSPMPPVPWLCASAMTSSIPGMIKSGAATGAMEPAFASNLEPRTLNPLYLSVAFDGIVLAQRMAFPVFRHHDPREARMAGKVDAEEVEYFALVKVRRGPDRGDRIDGEVSRFKPYNEAHALFQPVREDVIRELKARLLRIPVHRRHVLKKVVSGNLHRLTCGDNRHLGHGDRQFVAIEFRIGRQIL